MKNLFTVFILISCLAAFSCKKECPDHGTESRAVLTEDDRKLLSYKVGDSLFFLRNRTDTVTFIAVNESVCYTTSYTNRNCTYTDRKYEGYTLQFSNSSGQTLQVSHCFWLDGSQEINLRFDNRLYSTRAFNFLLENNPDTTVLQQHYKGVVTVNANNNSSTILMHTPTGIIAIMSGMDTYELIP